MIQLRGKRIRRSKGHLRRAWHRELVTELRTNGGRCRLCGGWFLHQSVQPGGLRLAHLNPHTAGRENASRESCTLACEKCDTAMGTRDWSGRVASLADDPNPSASPTESTLARINELRIETIELADVYRIRRQVKKELRWQAKFTAGTAGIPGGAT